jgi:hypothetical protein
MKRVLLTLTLFIAPFLSFSQSTEDFSDETFSGETITTNTGLIISSSNLDWSAYTNQLDYNNVLLSPPSPYITPSSNNDFFQITLSDQSKVFSSIEFDLWLNYGGMFGTGDMGCDCKSYTSENQLIETISKGSNEVAKNFIFNSGSIKKIICNPTNVEEGNNLHVDDIVFTIAQQENNNEILLNGTVSAENNQIKNVSDPTDSQDTATKNYVDSNVNSFSGSYNDLTDIPVLYSQDEVDALIDALRAELGDQIDNDGDGYTEDGGDCNDNDATIVPNGNEINGDGVDNDCDGEIDELPDNSGSSFSTADGKFIFGMGSNSYQISGYYAFDPNTKTFSSAELNPYQASSYDRWTKPAVGSNGKVYEFTSETVIRNATDDVSVTLPNGYKAYTYYDYVNGFDSNVSSAIFLVRTDSMSEHGVHLAYFDNQDNIQILNPGFEFRGGTEQMSPQYENGYLFTAKYGINNPEEYYIINFNDQNPQPVKINFPSVDSNASPYSKTYAGDGKFYISYRKNNDDYNTKTIYLLDTTADLVNNGFNVSEVFTTSSRADFLTYASNGKLYYNNEYGNNNDTNIYVYDPVTGVESSIAAPSGASSPILLSSYGNTVELNGNLFIRYHFSTYSNENVRNRLYKLNTSDNSLTEVNANGILNNYQYWTTYGPYSNAYILNQPYNPMFVYDDKLYMIFRGSSDYNKHYIMIYDGNNVELIDPEQSGGLKSFVEQMMP